VKPIGLNYGAKQLTLIQSLSLLFISPFHSFIFTPACPLAHSPSPSLLLSLPPQLHHHFLRRPLCAGLSTAAAPSWLSSLCRIDNGSIICRCHSGLSLTLHTHTHTHSHRPICRCRAILGQYILFEVPSTYFNYFNVALPMYMRHLAL